MKKKETQTTNNEELVDLKNKALCLKCLLDEERSKYLQLQEENRKIREYIDEKNKEIRSCKSELNAEVQKGRSYLIEKQFANDFRSAFFIALFVDVALVMCLIFR